MTEKAERNKTKTLAINSHHYWIVVLPIFCRCCPVLILTANLTDVNRGDGSRGKLGLNVRSGVDCVYLTFFLFLSDRGQRRHHISSPGQLDP